MIICALRFIANDYLFSIYFRHEINRLLLEYFGGNYKVQANAGEKPTILFTYPLGKN